MNMIEFIAGMILLILGIVGFSVAIAIGRNKRLKKDPNLEEYP